MVAELEAMQRIDIADTAEFVPHFDPAAFQHQHPNISLGEWRLEEDQLREYAVVVSQLRRKITEKAGKWKVGPLISETHDHGPRTRKG